MRISHGSIALGAFFLSLLFCGITSAEQNPLSTDQETGKAPLKATTTAGTPETKRAIQRPATKKTLPDARKTLPLGKIIVTRPAAGDHFFQGEEVVIEWSKQGEFPANCFKISLYKDKTKIKEITQSVCVNGYRWKIPADLWGPRFKIEVMTTDGKVSALSAPFPVNPSGADLTVGKLTAAPEKPQAGEEVTIRARIDNTGNTKSEPTKAFVIVGSWWNTWGNAKRTEYPVPALAFGDHIYITHKTQLPPGDWLFTVLLGKYPLPNQGDKYSPDTRSMRVSVYGDPLPDLVVCVNNPIYGASNPPNYPPGNYALIRAMVRNVGSSPMGPTKARISAARAGSFKIEVPVLKKNEDFIINKVVRLEDDEDASFVVKVDSDKSWTELSETNNSVSGKIVVKKPGQTFPEPVPVCSGGSTPAAPGN